jgi:hypothetical protein
MGVDGVGARRGCVGMRVALCCIYIQYRPAITTLSFPGVSFGPAAAALALPPRRLLERVRERARYLHYSLRTEQAAVHWVRAFVRLHRMRLGEALQRRVEDVERRVIVVRCGKDRVVMLPPVAFEPVPCYRVTPNSAAAATSAF